MPCLGIGSNCRLFTRNALARYLLGRRVSETRIGSGKKPDSLASLVDTGTVDEVLFQLAQEAVDKARPVS